MLCINRSKSIIVLQNGNFVLTATIHVHVCTLSPPPPLSPSPLLLSPHLPSSYHSLDAGLVCESLRCVGDVCAPRTVEYCLDHFAEFEPTLVELNFTCIAVSVMGWGSVTDQRSGGALIVTTRISSCSPITGWNCVDEGEMAGLIVSGWNF